MGSWEVSRPSLTTSNETAPGLALALSTCPGAPEVRRHADVLRGRAFAQGILVNHMSVGFRRAFRERTVAARRREGGDAAMSHFRFVQEWLESWNSRSPDRIMAHYADEAVFQSPSVLALRGLVTDRPLLLLQPLHPLKGTRTTASLTSRSIA